MSVTCFLCVSDYSDAKALCNHLREYHKFYDNDSNQKLVCGSGCPTVYKSYSGFRKHLKICLKPHSLLPSTSHNNTMPDLTIAGRSKDAEQHHTSPPKQNKNFACENQKIQPSPEVIKDKNNEMHQKVLTYVLSLYALGFPESTITTLLKKTSELIFPLLDDIVSTPELEKRKDLAVSFKEPFESQSSKYKRNKGFQHTIVHPVHKSHGIRIVQNGTIA